jgi:molecular chaperone DnaK (HSP70)
VKSKLMARSRDTYVSFLLTWHHETPSQTAEELSSMVLTKMKSTAEQYLNKPVK